MDVLMESTKDTEMAQSANRKSKRMSRMDKDKRKSIMVSLREINDSPMFDFSSLDAIGDSFDDDWSSLPPPPALNLPPKHQVALKDDSFDQPTSMKKKDDVESTKSVKQRKSGFSSVWSRMSSASTSSNLSSSGSVQDGKSSGRRTGTWMSKPTSSSSLSGTLAVPDAGTTIGSARPISSATVASSSASSLVLPAIEPIIENDLESSLSSLLFPSNEESTIVDRIPLKDEDEDEMPPRPLSPTAASSAAAARRISRMSVMMADPKASKRLSKRLSVMAGGVPVPPPRIRSGRLSYPVRLPDDIPPIDENAPISTMNAEDILSGKRETPSVDTTPAETSTASALSMLLSPVGEAEEEEEQTQVEDAMDEDDDIIIVEEEDMDEDTSANDSTAISDDAASGRTGASTPTPAFTGYATLTRVPPPSVKQVMNQPAIATSTLARTLAARLEHQQHQTLGRRTTTGSTGGGMMGTLTRFGTKNRSHSQSSEHAPSFSSLTRPGTPTTLPTRPSKPLDPEKHPTLHRSPPQVSPPQPPSPSFETVPEKAPNFAPSPPPLPPTPSSQQPPQPPLLIDP
ncbi:hypothetical protein BC829DRAFT_288764 [Chytridium lagenaria]|nr:hypothetical protein BC829DRAFT_288764 [Chytridium lagenaria]